MSGSAIGHNWVSTPRAARLTGPRFFGWVIGVSHPAGVAADWLTSAVEAVAAEWLLHLLALPRGHRSASPAVRAGVIAG
jgi:hypothetical protein